MRAMQMLRRGWRDAGGAAAVEFAIVGPVLILMLCGIMGYGGYFWISHAVQQVANDAARTALAGLNLPERQSLAQEVLADEIDDYAYLEAANAGIEVLGGEHTFTVQVTYDASGSAFWVLSKIVPMPDSQVRRTATVRLGGY